MPAIAGMTLPNPFVLRSDEVMPEIASDVVVAPVAVMLANALVPVKVLESERSDEEAACIVIEPPRLSAVPLIVPSSPVM